MNNSSGSGIPIGVKFNTLLEERFKTMEITKETLEKYYNSHTHKECKEFFFSISDKKIKTHTIAFTL